MAARRFLDQRNQKSDNYNEERKYGVGYIRVSSESQVERHSLENQEKRIQEYCENEGIYYIRTFADKGKSGRGTENRDEYMNMLNIVQPGWYVITYEVTRISRDQLEGTAVYRDLKNKGCIFISLCGIDSRKEDDFIVNLKFALAQEESDRISKRVKSNMNRLSDQGKLMCKPPFGWIHDDLTRKYFEEPEQQKALSKMIELFEEGLTFGKIAKQLNLEGYNSCINNNKKTKIDNPIFYVGGVKRILKNHGYVRGEQKPKFLIRERIARWNSINHIKKT